MGALIRWIQIGNWLSESYRANASTDTATVVGGVSVSAAVAAVLTTLAAVNPSLGLSAQLIATVTAVVGATAAQVIPWVKHWFDQRAAARQAEAKAAVDGSAFAAKIAADRAAVESGGAMVTAPMTDDSPIVSWVSGTSGKRYAAMGDCVTLGAAKEWKAVSAVLANGREWKA